MRSRLLIAALTMATSACIAVMAPDTSVFTLYRNSVTDENMRIHVATFDATVDVADGGSEAYNRENCEQAKELFQGQDGVKTKFWCEKGRFHR